MMKIVNLLFVSLILSLKNTNAAECENGWQIYKDELCVKAFTTSLLTYWEAQALCSTQSDGTSQATLVMVKKSEMQELLVNLAQDMNDNLWLGAQYDAEISEFTWSDGDLLSFTNWADGFPRNTTNSDLCIQFLPPNIKKSADHAGKWEDITCEKRNVPLCQRRLSWSLQDAFDAIVELREKLATTNVKHQETEETLLVTMDKLQTTEENLQRTQQNLQETQLALQSTQQILQETANNLQATNEQLQVSQGQLHLVSSRVVPVGSIYIEYYNQPSPIELWPGLSWEDVSGSYAGQFFRASGGGSEGWGVVQTECAPRLTEMSYIGHPAQNGAFPNVITIPANGYSEHGLGGALYGGNERDHWYEGLAFYTAGCEIRPTNQAIRIWKRTGSSDENP